MPALILLALLAASPTDGPVVATPPEPTLATSPFSIFNVHGLLQLQYLTVVRNDQPSPAETGFLLRRARVGVDGTVYSPRFGYRAELELALGTLSPLDVYAEFKPTPRWSIRAGQVRVPYSRNWLISEENLAFAERSVATDEFRYDYDIGLLASASFVDDRLTASFGILNGAGRNAPANDNVDPLFVARVNGTIGGRAPLEEGDLALTRPPSVTIGGAATFDYVPEPAAYGFSSGSPVAPVPIVTHDTNMNGRPDGVRVLELEGDLSFRWRGLALDGELYFRHEDWAEIGSAQPLASQFAPKHRFGGGFAQATYFIPAAHLQAGGRLALAEVSPLAVGGRKRAATSCIDLDGMPFPCALPLSDEVSELTLLVVGHWFGHGVQVTGMYSALRWRSDLPTAFPGTREQRFLAQTQLAF